MVCMEMITPFPISKTKIITPKRRQEIVTRPRLIETLYELLNKKLVLISAPAGYGKTSLLIDLANQSEIPVCWLSLDLLDQEPQRFLSYFVACIAERFPDFGKESFGALQNVSSLQNDTERLVVTLTNEMLLHIPEHFALVLDDYHFIDSIPEIRNFINRLVQLASENFHLILASRTLPFLSDLHLLAARNEVGGLSFEDLAFLPEEIRTYFRQNSNQVISLDDANRLAEQTEGWVTSLTLSSLSHIDVETKKGTPGARTGVEVFDYFAREILEKQPADIREFLLLTSLFDEVELDTCSKVLAPLLTDDSQDWIKLFEKVQKSSLFVIPLGVDGKSFRYHHLFQDFLRMELQAREPRLAYKVKSGLAQHYAELRDWEKAHFIYESLGDEDALVSLIEQAGMYFIRDGRIATLGNWLEHLPISLLQRRPALLSLQGTVTHSQGETQLGISLLSQAEAAFRENEDVNNLCITLVRRAAAYRQSGSYIQAMEDAEEVIQLTRNERKKNLQDSFAAAQRVKGLILYRLGKASEAVPWLENALNLFSFSEENNYYTPVLEAELGMVHRALGNDDHALKYYTGALKVWEKTGNLAWQASLLNNLGVLYHSRGAYEQAFTTLEKALDCARRSGYVRTQALALCSLGDLLADLHDLDRSEECYDQALVIASQLADRYLVFYASLAKARMARLRSNLELAERLLLGLTPNIENHPTSAEDEALFRLENGSLLLFSGRIHQSTEQLTRAVELYKDGGRLLDVCISRLWLACALIADRRQGDAVSQLHELFSASSNLKEPGFLYVNAEQGRKWLEKFEQSNDVAVSVQQLITKAGQFTRNIPGLRRKLRRISHIISISPPHLVIRSFGSVQVLYNGKKVTLSDWQTKETRDLFFFFLHSKPVTKEEIAAIFWPDISLARLKMRFKTSIYRLRHAVGQETILFEDERYRFNHGIDYEYDVENFHHLIEQADKTNNSAESVRLLKTAVDLAEGAYLADIEAEWTEPERLRLQNLYQAAILRLAGLYLDAGQAEKALEACRTILKTDPLVEEAYRLSMSAYASLGDRAAIVRQFRVCSDIFEDELGVKPSKETESLYRQLT